MTSEEDTMYYFDVQNAAFEGALKIFSSFFISPQFNETALEREINIVESEYRKNITNTDKAIN